LVNSVDGVTRLTLAETERRYTKQGLGWIMNNIAMSWSSRGKQDFVLGNAFRNQPERFASICAELTKPKTLRSMKPKLEAIAPTSPAKRNQPIDTAIAS
jgi:hypothetical protein